MPKDAGTRAGTVFDAGTDAGTVQQHRKTLGLAPGQFCDARTHARTFVYVSLCFILIVFF